MTSSAIAVVFLLIIITAVDLAEYKVAVRSHNLNVLYKSLHCEELVTQDAVTSCEEAIGKFMVPEEGLFTRQEP